MKYILFLLFILIVTEAKTQTTPEFNLGSVSGQILNAIDKQRISSTETSDIEFIKEANKIRLQLLANQKDNNLFLQNYNKAIREARRKVFGNDPIYYVSPSQLEILGSISLTNISANSTNRNYEGPLRSIVNSNLHDMREYLFGEALNETFEKKTDIVEKVSSLGIHLMTTVNGTKPSELSFENLVKYFTELESTPLLEKLQRGKIDSTLAASAMQLISTQKFTTYTESTATLIAANKSLYDNLLLEIKNEDSKQATQVGEGLGILANLTVETQFEFGSLSEEIQKSEEKIKGETAKIQKLLSVKYQNPLTDSEQAKLNDIQRQLSHEISKNIIRVELLNSYVSKGIGVANKLVELKSRFLDGSMSKLFSKEEQTKFLSRISKASIPELSIMVSDAVNGVDGAVQTLSDIGILSKNVAQKVSKCLRIAAGGAQVASGIAQLCSFNPIGLLSVFSGLGSIFGGEPKPSPEMQMMTEMMNQMNSRFDRIEQILDLHFNRIEQKLDLLSAKLEHLATVTIQAHKATMAAFEYVANELDEIKFLSYVATEHGKILILKDYNICSAVAENKIHEEQILELDDIFGTYAGLQSFYEDNSMNCTQCLAQLNSFANPSPLTTTIFYEIGSGDQGNLYNNVKRTYASTLKLFNYVYSGERRDLGVSSLSLPTDFLNRDYVPLSMIINNKIDVSSDLPADENTLFNADFLCEFSNHFVKLFCPYYEIHDSGTSGYRPRGMDSFINATNHSRDVRKSYLIKRLDFLLKMINTSLLQQSIIAGNSLIGEVYNSLFVDGSDPARTAKCQDALRFNSILSRNFSSYLINQQIDVNRDVKLMEFTNLYYLVQSDASYLDKLNDWFLQKKAGDRFFIDPKNGRLYLKLIRDGREVDLIVPEPSFIITNRFMNSGSYYNLISIKEKVVSKKMDLIFNHELPLAYQKSYRAMLLQNN